MSLYLFFKWLHILSSTILFGTGIGIAFFKWITDCSGDVRAIRLSSERTVLADWVFTTPAVILQPLSGLALAHLAGYPVMTGWVALSLYLYVLMGACWLPVVWLQLRMRALARGADDTGTHLPALYWKYARCWFWLGVPAFVTLLCVYWLMVAKPAL
jgi:uncharacterized membrane protein